jgi:hypothetical protein
VLLSKSKAREEGREGRRERRKGKEGRSECRRRREGGGREGGRNPFWLHILSSCPSTSPEVPVGGSAPQPLATVTEEVTHSVKPVSSLHLGPCALYLVAVVTMWISESPFVFLMRKDVCRFAPR